MWLGEELASVYDPRLWGLVTIYVVSWLVIFARNSRIIKRNKLFTIVLGVVFLFVSMLLGGFLIEGFTEMWISALSWPIVVSYMLLEFAKFGLEKDQTSQTFYAVTGYFESRIRDHHGTQQDQHTTQEEKNQAREMEAFYKKALGEIESLVEYTHRLQRNDTKTRP